MKRNARERHLMRKRMRIDIAKHGGRKDACDCTPGRFRKFHPLGCPRPRCGLCQHRPPTRQELRAEITEREWM